jgi:hypothetical protein
MTSKSLPRRLALLTNLFIVTSLSLGFEQEDFRAPGDPESGTGTGKYCPSCPRQLKWRQEDGQNVLFCEDDGEIDQADALCSPRS